MTKNKEKVEEKVEEKINYKNEEKNETITIDKWNPSAVKNSLDDYLMLLFNDHLKYDQSFKLLNYRLLISFAAVSATLYALVWDYFNLFPKSTFVLTICVITYFTLILILTYYSMFVEKDIFYVGKNKKYKLIAHSNLKRYDDKYYVKLVLEISNKRLATDCYLPISSYFDEEGTLVQSNLKKDILNLYNKLIESKNN